MNRLTRRLVLCTAGAGYSTLASASSANSHQLLFSFGDGVSLVLALSAVLAFILIWRHYVSVLRRRSGHQFSASAPAITSHRSPYHDFVQWARSIVVDHQPRAYAKGVLIRFHSSRNEMPFPYDPRRWKIILDDLITQALKISPRGSRIELGIDISPPGETAEVIIRVECSATDGTVAFSKAVEAPTHELIREMDGNLVVQLAPGQGRHFILKTPIPLPSIQGQPS